MSTCLNTNSLELAASGGGHVVRTWELASLIDRDTLDLPASALMVLRILCDHINTKKLASGDATVAVSIATIAELAGVTVRRIRQIMQTLESAGLAKRLFNAWNQPCRGKTFDLSGLVDKMSELKAKKAAARSRRRSKWSIASVAVNRDEPVAISGGAETDCRRNRLPNPSISNNTRCVSEEKTSKKPRQPGLAPVPAPPKELELARRAADWVGPILDHERNDANGLSHEAVASLTSAANATMDGVDVGILVRQAARIHGKRAVAIVVVACLSENVRSRPAYLTSLIRQPAGAFDYSLNLEKLAKPSQVRLGLSDVLAQHDNALAQNIITALHREIPTAELSSWFGRATFDISPTGVLLIKAHNMTAAARIRSSYGRAIRSTLVGGDLGISSFRVLGPEDDQTGPL